jgi:hypothetical protein
MDFWGEGMKDNDTALDGIINLKEIIAHTQEQNVHLQHAVDGEYLTDEEIQEWVTTHKIREALDEGYNSHGRLGIADWLMDHGVCIPYTIMRNDIEHELLKIYNWESPSARRKALIIFKKRCRHHTINI